VLSTKLVDGRAFGYTYDGQRDRTHIADCSSVDCNALSRVHRFVVQVVPTVVRQLSRFLLRQRVVLVAFLPITVQRHRLSLLLLHVPLHSAAVL